MSDTTKLDALKAAGAAMANILYNLSQLDKHQLTDAERRSMAGCQIAWEDARRTYLASAGEVSVVVRAEGEKNA